MAADEVQQERRSDTVALPRSTFKAATWLASLAFTGVAYFVWNSGTAVHDVDAELTVLELRISTLEDFAKAGGRFTKSDGDKLDRRIDRIADEVSKHNGESAHREQQQLNREIFWRLEKLEKPGSDSK